MTRFQYAMMMFTLVLILMKVSPIDEQLLWQTTAAAWFVAMIISLISTLTQHGNKKDDTTE